VQSGLEKVALPRILRVEKLKEVEDERLVDVPLGHVGVEVGALDESEEELVHDLEMGPGEFENRLILFWIESVARRIYGWGYGAEKVGRKLRVGVSNLAQTESGKDTDHANHLWVYILGDHTALGGDIVEHLMEGLGLDLLALELCAGVVEIEQDATLVEFLDKQLGALAGRGF
jgi:hypothetical protein